MKTYNNPAIKNWEAIMKRPVADTVTLRKTVRGILDKVKKKGDKAVLRYNEQFDGVSLKRLDVTEKEIEAAIVSLPSELKNAMQQAKKNIELFHVAQKEKFDAIETMPGVKCWRKSVGIEKVGLYIPGGSAPLFSTVLMLGVPAQLAGCREIVMCTPPSKDGSIHPAILFAASLCGITRIYKVGGVQAIAAMAYGTDSIPRTYKIFGPGNQYVTCAKQLIQLEGTAIDMPAGPSEVLVIADETCNPAFVAADLLSQAEHGPDSQVIIVTTKSTINQAVEIEIKKQLKELPRKKIAQQALKNSKSIILTSLKEAIEFSNQYAPEHLILAVENAAAVAGEVTAAGSVFIGNYSPESVGDYASGTNHTLPTNGFAAMYSGVSIDSFVKKITYQQLTAEGLKAIGNTVMIMAEAEGLDAHKNAVVIRLNEMI